MSANNKLCIHCFASGRVQGVWYRANTQKQAVALGLTGWACNLPDGRVEVMACGSRDQLVALYEWLQQGPPKAQVADVTYEELPWQEYVEFVVK